MVQLLQEGSHTNVPVEQWYVESEAEIEKNKKCTHWLYCDDSNRKRIKD